MSMSVSSNRLLGQAESTAVVDSAALRLYQVYRERKGKLPFAQMREIEITADNLEYEMLSFTTWCASTPIPRNFDDSLQPKRQSGDGPTTLLATSTLVKYAGKILLQIRRRFPTHPDFVGLKSEKEVPPWWTRMHPNFEKELDQFYMRLGSDYTFGETKTRPLYSDNRFVGYDGELNLPINDFISATDLKSILANLMRSSVLNASSNSPGKLQQRAWLSILYNAVGRGGEIKFVDTAEWVYHPRFEAIDILWLELKTKQKYAMPMVPDKENYLQCFYHALGCYWSVENGLFRMGEDEIAIQTFLFPNLHSLADSGVSKKVTTIIRENLKMGCPKPIKDSFSAKSIRKGAITELSLHRNMDTLDVCGRSGHSTGTTLDTYMDKMFIVRGLGGAKVLAHFRDPNTETKVPRLECLGVHTASAVEALVEALFVISLPAFKSGGHLHIVVRTCTASLIMHHTSVMKDFSSGNSVATKLRNAAREARISDTRYPQLAPELILNKWSEMILTDFQERNPEIAAAELNMASLTATVNHQSAVMTEMYSLMKTMDKRLAQSSERETALMERVSVLENEREEMREQLSVAEAKLGLLKTPETVRRRQSSTFDRNVSARSEAQTSPRQATTAARVTTTAAPAAAAPAPAASAPTAAPSAPQRPASVRRITTSTYQPRPIQWSAEASANLQRLGKGVTISMLLTDLHNGGRLNREQWKNVKVPDKYTEKQSVRNTLELCDDVVMDEEKHTLKRSDNAKNLSNEEFLTLVRSIETRAFERMWELEGKTIEVERQVEAHKNPSQQVKPVYIGLGKRVRIVKQKLSARTGSVDYNIETLRVLPRETPPGTPEDNRSVATMFNRTTSGDNA